MTQICQLDTTHGQRLHSIVVLILKMGADLLQIHVCIAKVNLLIGALKAMLDLFVSIDGFKLDLILGHLSFSISLNGQKLLHWIQTIKITRLLHVNHVD